MLGPCGAAYDEYPSLFTPSSSPHHSSSLASLKEMTEESISAEGVLGPLTRWSTISAAILLLWDWILTLDREVKYFWVRIGISVMFREPVTTPVLILVHRQTRYLPLISQAVNVLGQALSRERGDSNSDRRFTLKCESTVSRSREIGSVGLLIVSVGDAARTKEPYTQIVFCFVAGSPSYIWGFWIPVFVFEVVAFACVGFKAFLRYRSHRALESRTGDTLLGMRLMDVIFYDSFIYFATVGVLFLVMALLCRYVSKITYLMGEGWVFSLVSLLSCRMLLNLRTTADEEFHSVDGMEMSVVSTVKFRVGEGTDNVDFETEESEGEMDVTGTLELRTERVGGFGGVL
ncbi:hypothetical protein SISSUDRAFT_1036814 [Sistotremastrum suecicum HHB10207 ss-3]|uniref:DUF6533 domain-containing protein n=1 Tax=Sistotremastrum suecicum HHB10207 ss-3 TaxID=1314776 RepID=A0A165YZG3_9AGAM|nr:hypothetical protein SISSUDRAFT_1036814 [Sistotremastrum suecicum HHB10207 ss-3]